MVQHNRNIPDPVEFPSRDGPLFVFISKTGQGNDNVEGGVSSASTKDSCGLEEASTLFLLNNEKNSNAVVNDLKTSQADEAPIQTFSIQLISQLQYATSLKEQLLSLRAYKSNIINIQKLQPSHLDNKCILDTIIGMYRIIFELCLSHKSPQAIKKAGYSCISALLQHSSNEKTKTSFDEIHTSIIMSLFLSIDDKEKSVSGHSCDVWKEPVQTLFDMISYEPTKILIMQSHRNITLAFELLLLQGSKFNKQLSMNGKGKNSTMNEVVGAKALQAVEKLFEICTTLKVILTSLAARQNHESLTNEEKQEILALFVSTIDILFKPLLCCRAASTDALSCCGVCYGQILSFKWSLESTDDEGIAENVAGFIGDLIDKGDEAFNSLPTVMIIKGLVSTLTDCLLISFTKQNLIIHTIATYMLQTFQQSSNDAIRLWSLKGLETVLGRCKSMIASNTQSLSFISYVTELANDVLQLSLVTFDSPPGRQVSSAMPGLFKSLVNVMEELDRYHDDGTQLESMDVLVSRVLSQPSSRKGKYIALDTLLYKVGASKLLRLAASQGSECLVSSFVKEIGDRGNSAGAVAELLGKILSLLREEMHKEEGIDLNRVNESKKERRKTERKIREQVGVVDQVNETVKLLQQWMNAWVPSFASAMLDTGATRRNHISSYCLPLIVVMVGGPARKIDACHSYAALLTEINNREDSNDHVLWAKLEVSI